MYIITENWLLSVMLAYSIIGSYVLASSDDQCCRKRIECFECDSRTNPGCGDAFNMTRENGNFIHCNDLCVKLRHKFENQYYYIRSCADQFKNILIKKTEVCYSTRKKDGSYLCFCNHDRCNRAAPSSRLHLVDAKLTVRNVLLGAAYFLVYSSFVTNSASFNYNYIIK